MMNSGNIVAKDVVKMEVLNRNAVASGHLHQIFEENLILGQ